MFSKLKKIATHPAAMFAAGVGVGLIVATTAVGYAVTSKIAGIRASVGV